MSTHKQHAKRNKFSPQKGESPRHGPYWMYGWHAVIAALNNPERQVQRLLVTTNSAAELPAFTNPVRPETSDGKTISQLLPNGSVHQGIAALVRPLEARYVHEIMLEDAPSAPPLLLLDQVTDPHNVGAILRSASAYGAGAVIVTKDHGVEESATIAKAACGALEHVPLVTVVNLAQTILELQRAGYWVWGLDGNAKTELHREKPAGKTALVLGAEGKGLRRLTAERCDSLIKLPMAARMESLNVSNATAIALYQLYLHRQSA
jgi:23S rRNA (guanosine2251-2'-O)-methyltransferase